jgi:hypothetical protein
LPSPPFAPSATIVTVWTSAGTVQLYVPGVVHDWDDPGVADAGPAAMPSPMAPVARAVTATSADFVR